MRANLISVIVPVYNGEAYLDRCVRSIRNQTYTDWELLLIDGASLDATPEICDAWQKKDSRIRAFHTEKNLGVSAGRNTGMKQARGAYLMFVDADDWLLPDCLQMMYEELQESGAQIARCDFISCTDRDWEGLQRNTGRQQAEQKAARKENAGRQQEESGSAQRPTAGRQDRPGRKLLAGEDFLREGILERDTHCWGKLYRREAVEGFLFREDFTIGEDMLFLWDITQGRAQISSCGAAGYCYYHNQNGTMLKPFRDSDMDQIRCWQLLLEQLTGETERAKTASILLVSCMLTVGKISLLPAERRKEYRHHTMHCRKVLQETLQIAGAFEGLDRGYRLKVRFFEKAPDLYLCLYHSLKKRKENMQ